MPKILAKGTTTQPKLAEALLPSLVAQHGLPEGDYTLSLWAVSDQGHINRTIHYQIEQAEPNEQK